MRHIIILILLSSGLFADTDLKSILNSNDSDSVKVNQLNAFARNTNDFALGREALDSAFTKSHNNIYHFGKALSYQSYGYLYLKADSVIRAIDYFKLAIIGFKDLKSHKEIAETQYQLARTYQAIGMLDVANSTYFELLKTYEKIGTRVGHVYLQLAQNYDKMGVRDSAVMYSSYLQDSEIRPIKYSKTFSEIQKSEIQNEIQVNELKNEIEKAKFRTDVIAFLLGILLLISLFIILYLILKLRSIRKKAKD